MLFLVLGTNLYASNSMQYNQRLDQDRVLLEQLITQLKQHGVNVEPTLKTNASTSKMEEHAVLQAKIVHFQTKLQKVISSSYCTKSN